jgi:hypothetical protein
MLLWMMNAARDDVDGLLQVVRQSYEQEVS